MTIEHDQTLSEQLPGLRKEERHEFTLVFTAWKHSKDVSTECEEGEMTCPTSDGGAHKDKTRNVAS